MKAVILAAGKGSRLAELNLIHKSFAVVNKRHIIDYSLDLCVETNERLLQTDKPGISAIVLVVGYNAQSIIDYVGDSYRGIPVSYAFQNEQLGIAHAVKVAKDIINDDVIMLLADEVYYNPRLAEMVCVHREGKLECVCGCVVDAEDFSYKPIAYEIDDSRNVTDVTEKPSAYSNAYRGIGCCIYSNKALALLDELEPNAIRGEYEMGDWERLIAKKLGKTKVFDFADAYVNVNYSKDIAAADEMLARSGR